MKNPPKKINNFIAWALPPFTIIAWGLYHLLFKSDSSTELTVVLLATPLLIAPLMALILNYLVPIAINGRVARKYALPSFITYSLYAMAFLESLVHYPRTPTHFETDFFPFLEFACIFLPISFLIALEVAGCADLGANLRDIRNKQGRISSSQLIKIWMQDPLVSNIFPWVLPILSGLGMVYWLFMQFFANYSGSNLEGMRVWVYELIFVSASFLLGGLSGFIVYRAWKARFALLSFLGTSLGVAIWVVIAYEIRDAIYRQAWW